jgi:hypothetical protein
MAPFGRFLLNRVIDIPIAPFIGKMVSTFDGSGPKLLWSHGVPGEGLVVEVGGLATDIGVVAVLGVDRLVESVEGIRGFDGADIV